MTRQTLQWLIAIEICLLIVGVKVDWWWFAHLESDPALEEWLLRQERQNLIESESVLVLMALGILPIIIFVWVWLWMLKPYSRPLYVLTLIPGFLLMPTSGLRIAHGWTDLLETLSAMVTGMIIACLYFTDVYPHKDRRTFL